MPPASTLKTKAKRQLAPGEPRFRSPRPTLPGAYFDQAAADAAVAFFTDYCCLTADEFAGHPFALQPWQADIVAQAFGWKRADGSRLYRRVIIWVPRKNGKTELMAGIAHLCILGDAIPGSETYVIASSEDQAHKVFDASSQMVAYSPALADCYEVFEKSLYCSELNAKYQPLTGKAHGKHGLKCTYLIGDEVHEWKSDRLYTYVRQSMASRAEPMQWLISTAGVEDGYGVELWTESLQICQGDFEEPETLVYIWCADPDPAADIDITDPQVWAEANPNLGISLRRDYLERESRESKRSASKSNDFRCYHLNLWVGQAERWLPAESWAACNPGGGDRWRRFEEELAGRKCYGGIDIASTRDWCALVWAFPPDDPAERWRWLCRFWWPERQMRDAALRSRVPFEKWAAEGAFTATPGNAADHKAIEEQVIADCARFQVQQLGVDVFNTHSVMTNLVGEGVPIVPVRFAMLSMSAPSKEFERLVLEEQLDHGGQPVLRWMAANCAVRKDRNENIMPCKKSSSGKIDGIAAGVIAHAVSATAEVPQSYVTSSGMMVL